MNPPPAMLEIYTALDRMHAWRGWHWWPGADPFEVAVGSILVQNTMWTNVERALDRLRAAGALDPAAMAALSGSELEDLVRPSGQFRQKARKLRAFLDLISAHEGLEALLSLEPATLRDRLLATWGIGPETADCIVCYAAGQPALVIDAYTMRLFGRLGLGPPGTDYHEWQGWMAAAIHREHRASPTGMTRRNLYARYHALIVMHAKHLCQKRAPACTDCELSERCAFASQARG